MHKAFTEVQMVMVIFAFITVSSIHGPTSYRKIGKSFLKYDLRYISERVSDAVGTYRR